MCLFALSKTLMVIFLYSNVKKYINLCAVNTVFVIKVENYYFLLNRMVQENNFYYLEPVKHYQITQ